MSSRWDLKNITFKVVQEEKYRVAVLPVGSTEPHGFHLPYGTDTIESEGIAKRICQEAEARGAKVVLLPSIPYGVDSNMMEFPMTINVHQSTLNTLIGDIVRSLDYHKVPNLVILNGHGGNEFRPLLRELSNETEVFMSSVDWWKVGQDVYDGIFEEGGEHAHEMEAAVTLALCEEVVHMEDAGDGKVRKSRFEAVDKGWAVITRPWHLLTDDSTFGNPKKATAEKGERYIEIIVERISKYIRQLSDSQRDETFPFLS